MKNNTKIMPIIIIIITILILLIIYILFFKKSVNNESPTTSTTTIITKKVNNVDPAASATTMLYTLQSFNNCNTGYILDFSSKNKLEYNDLNNDFIYNTIYNYLKYNKKIKRTNSNQNTSSMIVSDNNYVEEEISLNDFLNAYEKLYGISTKDIKYENHFSIGAYNYDLNANNIYYSKKTKPLNCLVNNTVAYLLHEQNATESKIELTYIVFYSIFEYKNNNVEPYATNKKDGEKICSGDKVSNPEYINNFAKYKFTFIYKDYSYVFDNVTLIN